MPPYLPILNSPGTTREARITPEALGSNQGRALVELGGAIAQVGSEVRQATDHIYHVQQSVRSRRQIAEAAKAARQLLGQMATDPDLDTVEERTEKGLAEIRAQFGEGLSGQYADLYELEYDELQERVQVGVRGEVYKRRVGVARAESETAIRTLGDLYSATDDPIERNTYLEQIDGLVGPDSDLVRAGAISPKQALEMRRQVLDNALEARFARQLREGPDVAAEALEKDPDYGHWDEKSRQAAITKIDNAREHEAVKERVAHRQARAARKRADALHDNANFHRVLDLGGAMSPDEIDALDWRSASARARALQWTEQVAEQTEGKEAAVTDWAYYAELNRMRAESPEAFITTPIEIERLSDQDKRFWLKAQAAAVKGDAEKVYSFHTAANRAWAEIKKNGDKGWIWGKDLGDEERGVFDSLLEQRVTDFQREKNRAPSGPEFQQIMNEASVEFTKRTNHGNKLERSFTPPQPDFRIAPPRAIPSAWRAEVEKDLRERNIPITELALAQRYRELVEQGVIEE